MNAHTAYHFALYDAARSNWLLRLIRPAWDSCERYRPVLLAKGEVQDRHEELDVELPDACAGHDPDRAAAALREHRELATAIYAVGRGPQHFAFLGPGRTTPGRPPRLPDVPVAGLALLAIDCHR